MKSRIHIDWPNHLVAFVSTILGIFIAFQLDDWQEQRKLDKNLKATLEALHEEIEANLAIYEKNVERLSEWLDYYDFMSEHTVGNDLIVSESKLNAVRVNNPTRFKDLRQLRRVNDSLNAYVVDIKLDVLPITGVSTNNWQAAKSSGILTFLDHETITKLTFIYDWIERDFGMDENQFFKNKLQGSREDDGPKMIEDYRRIVDVTQFRLSRIKEVSSTLKIEKEK